MIVDLKNYLNIVSVSLKMGIEIKLKILYILQLCSG